MTNKELKNELDKLGVTYPKRANKNQLESILVESKKEDWLNPSDTENAIKVYKDGLAKKMAKDLDEKIMADIDQAEAEDFEEIPEPDAEKYPLPEGYEYEQTVINENVIPPDLWQEKPRNGIYKLYPGKEVEISGITYTNPTRNVIRIKAGELIPEACQRK